MKTNYKLVNKALDFLKSGEYDKVRQTMIEMNVFELRALRARALQRGLSHQVLSEAYDESSFTMKNIKTRKYSSDRYYETIDHVTGKTIRIDFVTGKRIK